MIFPAALGWFSKANKDVIHSNCLFRGENLQVEYLVSSKNFNFMLKTFYNTIFLKYALVILKMLHSLQAN